MAKFDLKLNEAEKERLQKIITGRIIPYKLDEFISELDDMKYINSTIQQNEKMDFISLLKFQKELEDFGILEDAVFDDDEDLVTACRKITMAVEKYEKWSKKLQSECQRKQLEHVKSVS